MRPLFEEDGKSFLPVLLPCGLLPSALFCSGWLAILCAVCASNETNEDAESLVLFDFWCNHFHYGVSPKTFKFIKFSNLSLENVHHDIRVIHEDPLSVLESFTFPR